MATTLSTAAAQAGCNAIVDLLDGDTGDSNGDASFATSGDVEVVKIELSDPAFGAASAAVPSVATLAGVPLLSSAAGVGGGTITKLRWRDKANNTQWTDSVGTSGETVNIPGGTTLAEGDKVSLTSYTVSVQGA